MFDRRKGRRPQSDQQLPFVGDRLNDRDGRELARAFAPANGHCSPTSLSNAGVGSVEKALSLPNCFQTGKECPRGGQRVAYGVRFGSTCRDTS